VAPGLGSWRSPAIDAKWSVVAITRYATQSIKFVYYGNWKIID